ncbi:hypothetical protein B0T14DRAFT_426012 [Immersiella caudata]|uniref:Uncharacterized protein n=1 Tax=Immersiella caudata TaxID=314043 RepID=A0AA39WZA2_9PEZI|nr:hypothetical protein B0T14DRAFT_426012 [Immersiella caudata]
MTHVESKIAQASLKNRELLTILSQTDHAPAQLAQQRRLITDLNAALDESDRKLAFLSEKRHKEFREHKAYRDSFVRRHLYKASGKGEKFAEKAKKEEEEYFAVLQKEQQYQGVHRDLKEQLAKAQEESSRLDGEVTRHESAQGELDRMYESIFGGPTEGLPEEDAAEEKVKSAMRAYQVARGRAEEEHMAVQLLGDAQKRMGSAIRSMQEALSASQYDMWSSNSFADMMERNALHRAEAETISARMQVVQAQRFDPRSMARVQQAAARLDQIAAEAQGRFGDLDAEFRRKEKELNDARVALQKVRERAFESLSEPPPAYGAGVGL